MKNNDLNRYFAAMRPVDREVIIDEQHSDMPVYLFEPVHLVSQLPDTPEVTIDSPVSAIFCFKEQGEYEYFDYIADSAKVIIEQTMTPKLEYVDTSIIHQAAYAEYYYNGFTDATYSKYEVGQETKTTGQTSIGTGAATLGFTNSVVGLTSTALRVLSDGRYLDHNTGEWVQDRPTVECVRIPTSQSQYKYAIPNINTRNNCELLNINVSKSYAPVLHPDIVGGIEPDSSRVSTISSYNQDVQSWTESISYGAPDLPDVGATGLYVGPINPNAYDTFTLNIPYYEYYLSLDISLTTQHMDNLEITTTLEGTLNQSVENAINYYREDNWTGQVIYSASFVNYPTLSLREAEPFIVNTNWNAFGPPWPQHPDYLRGISNLHKNADGTITVYDVTGTIGTTYIYEYNLMTGLETITTTTYLPSITKTDKSFEIWESHKQYKSVIDLIGYDDEELGASDVQISEQNVSVIDTYSFSQESNTTQYSRDILSPEAKLIGTNFSSSELVAPFVVKNPNKVTYGAGSGNLIVSLYNGLTSNVYKEQYGDYPPFDVGDVAKRVYLRMMHPKEYEN